MPPEEVVDTDFGRTSEELQDLAERAKIFESYNLKDWDDKKVIDSFAYLVSEGPSYLPNNKRSNIYELRRVYLEAVRRGITEDTLFEGVRAYLIVPLSGEKPYPTSPVALEEAKEKKKTPFDLDPVATKEHRRKQVLRIAKRPAPGGSTFWGDQVGHFMAVEQEFLEQLFMEWRALGSPTKATLAAAKQVAVENYKVEEGRSVRTGEALPDRPGIRQLRESVPILESQVAHLEAQLAPIQTEEYQEKRIADWRNKDEPIGILKLRVSHGRPREEIDRIDELQEANEELNIEDVERAVNEITPARRGEDKQESIRHLIGFTTLMDGGTQYEEQGRDAETEGVVEKLPAEGAPYDARKMAEYTKVIGELRTQEMIDVFKKLRENGFVITEDILTDTLRAKNYEVPDNFFKTQFYEDLLISTRGPSRLGIVEVKGGLPTDVLIQWNKLNRGLREAVFSRVVRLPSRPDQTPEQRIKLAESREMQLNSPLHSYKSAVQEVRDLRNLQEMRKRALGWMERIKEEVRKRNIPDVNKTFFTIDSDIGLLMDQAEDLVINGPMAEDADGNAVYRPAYKNGAVSALQNYGTQLVFNLSQIEKQYQQGLDTDIDTLIKDAVVHEGTHIHVLKDLLDSERRALDTYGKKQYVPKEVSLSAAKRKLTWRQYVEELYSDLPDADLTEETSVRILDALAQGKIAEAKSAGTIGKIKRGLISRFEATIGATRDTDILPILRIFEGIQNRDILQRRERTDNLAQKAGSLQLMERASKEDQIRLKDAIKEGDKEKIEQIADQIIESRVEPTEQRTKNPTKVLLESLVNDLRARQEIENTPLNVVNSVLNLQAIQDGLVSPEALDAYFRFRDGRKPAYRMPLNDRELRLFRWGKSDQPASEAVNAYSAQARASGLIGESDPASQQIITAMSAHTRRVQKGLKEEDQFIGSEQDFRELVDYTRGQLFRKKFLDKRLPMWKSSKRAYGREIKLYETSLGRLAMHSAVQAWRFADNAMNFIPGVMQYGMLSYVNGGFRLMPLKTDGRRVKGLMDIFRPILRLGKEVESTTLAYMAALRVRGVRNKLREANYNRKRLPSTASLDAIQEADKEVDYWEDTYERTNTWNPRTKERNIPDGEGASGIDEIESRVVEVEQGAKEGDVGFQAAVTFSKEYQDFNIQLIEFSYQTAIIGSKDRDRMRSMPYVPFYRDRGWDENVPLENQQNETVEKQALAEDDPLAGEEDVKLRGAPLIEKAIRGSFLPIKDDLIGNITKNVQSLIRDGMTNVAAGRTMRDEVANGTAVEIPDVPADMYIRKRFLDKRIARRVKQKNGLW